MVRAVLMVTRRFHAVQVIKKSSLKKQAKRSFLKVSRGCRMPSSA